MEMPPRLAAINKFNNLRVPPGQAAITNAELANFDQVLVIIKNENRDIIGAEWAPIAFAKFEANRKTLKIVNGNDIADIQIHNRLGCNYDITNDNILISDTFLTAAEVAALVDLLNENDSFYNDLYQQALALQATSTDLNPQLYQQFIAKVGYRLDRTNKVYALALVEWKSKKEEEEGEKLEEKARESKQPTDEIEMNRKSANKPGSQYPELEQIDLSGLDILSKEAFDKAFRSIKYKVKPNLPKYSYNKIKGFLQLINLLIDIIPNEVESYERKSEVNNVNGLTTINRDVDVMNIPQLMAFAVASVELCTIIPHLLDLPPKAISAYEKYNRSEIGIGAFNYDFFNTGLLMLVNQEVRDVVTNYNAITWDSAYIIPYKVYQYYMENTVDTTRKIPAVSWKRSIASVDKVFELIDYYSQGLIAKLDLTDSYVTGSILPACIGCPKLLQPKFYIDTWYPAVYTVPNNYDKYRRIVADLTRLKVNDHGDYVDITNGQENERLSLADGADIDIAVGVETEEEFEQIVAKHIDVIKQVYGNIAIDKIERKSGFTYEITGGHRMVQIYRSGIGQILSHHLPVVRGCITGNGSDRQIYISATAFHSYRSNINYNYYYFAGKYNPSEVILKYQQRGFKTSLSPFLFNLLDKYQDMTPKWNSNSKKYVINNTKGPIFGALKGYGNFYLDSIWAEDALNSYFYNIKLTMIQTDLLKNVLSADAYQNVMNMAGTVSQKINSKPARRYPSVAELSQITPVGLPQIAGLKPVAKLSPPNLKPIAKLPPGFAPPPPGLLPPGFVLPGFVPPPGLLQLGFTPPGFAPTPAIPKSNRP